MQLLLYLDEVEGLGALGEDEDALAGCPHEGHQAVHELPLGGHAHHLAVLLILWPGVVQQVRVVAHLHTAADIVRYWFLYGSYMRVPRHASWVSRGMKAHVAICACALTKYGESLSCLSLVTLRAGICLD